MSHPEFIQKIDWKLLREQKLDVLQIINDIEENAQYDSEPDSELGVYNNWIESLEGLISLIDSLQDYATDEMGLSDKEVFNLNEEE